MSQHIPHPSYLPLLHREHEQRLRNSWANAQRKQRPPMSRRGRRSP